MHPGAHEFKIQLQRMDVPGAKIRENFFKPIDRNPYIRLTSDFFRGILLSKQFKY